MFLTAAVKILTFLTKRHLNADGLDDLNDYGLRKTQFSQIYEKPIHEPKKAEAKPTITERPPASSKQNNINTWNGRQKQTRASLTGDTFTSPFVRGSAGRRSVSAANERRSSSATTSPTKGRLKQELLNAVKKTDSDAAIVQQLQELLKKYGSIGEDLDRGGFGGRSKDERMSFRSPRKDSRPENLTRIPAPVNKV